MICYSCNNSKKCSIFRELYDMSDDFSVNQCKNYNEGDSYRNIAKNDKLMRLIYDYFTGQLVGVSEEEARKAIECNMSYL